MPRGSGRAWAATSARISLFAVLVGLGVSYFFFDNPSPASYWIGASIGFFGTWTIAIIERFALPVLRKTSFLLEILAVTVVRLVSMALIAWLVVSTYLVLLGAPVGAAIARGARDAFLQPRTILIYLVVFLITLAVTFAIALDRKLGPGVLIGWLGGRYRRPRAEERVVMFLDLNDSTAHAERLGDEAFSELIRDFMADLTDPILATRAQISHYVGDEVILTWHLDRRRPTAAWPRLLDLAKARFRERASHYVTRYGTAPAFKAGVHAGRVIATEVGVLKSEIVFHGDALNVCARLAGLSRSLGAEALASPDAVAVAAELAPDRVTSRGEQRLRGREGALQALAIRIDG